jgi:hypothetical protein
MGSSRAEPARSSWERAKLANRAAFESTAAAMIACCARSYEENVPRGRSERSSRIAWHSNRQRASSRAAHVPTQRTFPAVGASEARESAAFESTVAMIACCARSYEENVPRGRSERSSRIAWHSNRQRASSRAAHVPTQRTFPAVGASEARESAAFESTAAAMIACCARAYEENSPPVGATAGRDVRRRKTVAAPVPRQRQPRRPEGLALAA